MPPTDLSTPTIQRWAVFFASLSAALLGACLFLWKTDLQRTPGLDSNPQKLLDDPRVRERVVAQLVERSAGIFDSHPDPDVGRVLLPDLAGRAFQGGRVFSNGRGMPEREYALPKPENTLRVVLLGDSYVFGYGVEQDQRMGAHLERFLRARLDHPGEIECLHLGIGSWNAVAEAEYCRRQLSELDPDLVVQLLIVNDIDDSVGVRGFGEKSDFVPRHRGRANAQVHYSHPVRYTDPENTNLLIYGVDWEGRTRFEELAAHVERLAAEVERQGGEYFLVVHWTNLNRILHPYLQGRIPADRTLYLPREFYEEPEAYWVGPDDAHFSVHAHEVFARLVYGAIRLRGWLDDFHPSSWPEAEELAQVAFEEGHEHAAQPFDTTRLPGRPMLDFTRISARVMKHVYAGIDGEGRAYPYASLTIKRRSQEDEPCERLGVRLRFFDRPEIDGGRVRIFVEEYFLAELRIRAGESLSENWPLPPEVRERTFLNVRFESDDWIHGGPDGRQCWSFVLKGVALLP